MSKHGTINYRIIIEINVFNNLMATHVSNYYKQYITGEFRGNVEPIASLE